MSSTKGYTGTGDKADLNNHANQLNPNNSAFGGGTTKYTGTGTKSDLGNHSNQLNPNNQRFAGGSR